MIILFNTKQLKCIKHFKVMKRTFSEMSEKRRIVLFASEIAGLISKNPYEPVSKCWNKVFQRVVKDGEAVLAENKIEVAKTDQQIIQEITSKNGVKLSTPSFQSRQFATLADLKQDKEKILAEIEGNTKLKKEEKQVLKKSVNSQLQKDFGTKEETSVTDVAEKLIGKQIEKTYRFVMKKMFETETIAWYVGGRVDGLTKAGEVVEIKNRMRRLFNEVKQYEYIQLITYLFIHSAPGGYLVEGFKSPEKLLTNHNFVDFDADIWQNEICDNLKKAGDLFDKTGGLQNPKFFLDGLKEIPF